MLNLFNSGLTKQGEKISRLCSVHPTTKQGKNLFY